MMPINEKGPRYTGVKGGATEYKIFKTIFGFARVSVWMFWGASECGCEGHDIIGQACHGAGRGEGLDEAVSVVANAMHDIFIAWRLVGLESNRGEPAAAAAAAAALWGGVVQQ